MQPVHPVPPHCAYFATEQDPLAALVVAALVVVADVVVTGLEVVTGVVVIGFVVETTVVVGGLAVLVVFTEVTSVVVGAGPEPPPNVCTAGPGMI